MIPWFSVGAARPPGHEPVLAANERLHGGRGTMAFMIAHGVAGIVPVWKRGIWA